MPTVLGHTLGTPSSTPLEALDLFAAAGLDGAELIWQDGYRGAIPESDDGRVAAQVKAHADTLGLRIGCLTPYVTGINSLDAAERRHEVARLERAIMAARSLGSPRIRIYGGTLLGDEPEADVPRLWSHLVESLRELATMALDHDVVLCVENHFGTMTVSAAETVALVEEVGSAGVGILYDQANLTFTHREDFPEAIDVQAPWIRHVHVKDLEFIHPDRPLKTARVVSIDKSERIHASRLIGDGILDWGAIVAKLQAAGYDGTYSLEYEYRWNPEDLPEPSVGIPLSTRRLRTLLAQAAELAVPADGSSIAGPGRAR